MSEAAIRQRIADAASAIRAKNVDGVLSLYAPGVVSFDVGAPLRYTGADNKRRAWEEMFAAFDGPIAYDLHELSVTTDGALAFVHSLNHVSGALTMGRANDMWVRWTACFRRIDNVWLVVHDHVSVPANLEHGQAILDLIP